MSGLGLASLWREGATRPRARATRHLERNPPLSLAGEMPAQFNRLENITKFVLHLTSSKCTRDCSRAKRGVELTPRPVRETGQYFFAAYDVKMILSVLPKSGNVAGRTSVSG